MPIRQEEKRMSEDKTASKQELYIRIRENATVQEAIGALKGFNERFQGSRHAAIGSWNQLMDGMLEIHAIVYGEEFTEKTIKVWSCCVPQVYRIEAYSDKGNWSVYQ